MDFIYLGIYALARLINNLFSQAIITHFQHRNQTCLCKWDYNRLIIWINVSIPIIGQNVSISYYPSITAYKNAYLYNANYTNNKN